MCITYDVFVQAADLKTPIDQRVIDVVQNLVDSGVSNISEMQRHVCLFIKNLFSSGNMGAFPNATNRRFYPSRLDLSNIMCRRRRSNLHGLLDQEALREKIDEWKSQNSSDFWLFRQSTSNADVDDNVDDRRHLLLIYQNSWQKRLLQRYGQEIVYMDATYRTTQYAIPLFFVCVHTNVGYIVVAVMIMEKEDTVSLTEALRELRVANQNFSPRAFMVDAAEVEMSAIRNVFPGNYSGVN